MFDEFLHISDRVFYYFHLPAFSRTFIPQNLENKRPHINTSSYFLWNVRKLKELLIFSTDVNVSRLSSVSRKTYLLPQFQDDDNIWWIHCDCATEDLKLVYYTSLFFKYNTHAIRYNDRVTGNSYINYLKPFLSRQTLVRQTSKMALRKWPCSSRIKTVQFRESSETWKVYTKTLLCFKSISNSTDAYMMHE